MRDLFFKEYRDRVGGFFVRLHIKCGGVCVCEEGVVLVQCH